MVQRWVLVRQGAWDPVGHAAVAPATSAGLLAGAPGAVLFEWYAWLRETRPGWSRTLAG